MKATFFNRLKVSQLIQNYFKLCEQQINSWFIVLFLSTIGDSSAVAYILPQFFHSFKWVLVKTNKQMKSTFSMD